MFRVYVIIIFLNLGLLLTGATTGSTWAKETDPTPAFIDAERPTGFTLAKEIPLIKLQPADGQRRQPEQNLTLERAAGGNLLVDMAYLLTAPTRWQRKEWLKASLIVGSTIFIAFQDEQIRELVQNKRNRMTDGVADLFRHGGELQFILPGLGLFYLWGRISGEEKLLQAGIYGLESLGITLGLTGTIKLLGHRHRPGSGDGGVWEGPGLAFDDLQLSFPSAHAAIAFSTAGIMAAVYAEDYRLIPALAYGIAGLTAWSRVNDDRHWASDVVAGSVIGYFTARMIAQRHLGQTSNLSCWPSWNGERMGLNFYYLF